MVLCQSLVDSTMLKINGSKLEKPMQDMATMLLRFKVRIDIFLFLELFNLLILNFHFIYIVQGVGIMLLILFL